MPSDRTHARQLAKEFLDKGDAIGWFEPLYTHADGNEQLLPWADLIVNPHLQTWLVRKNLSGKGRKALVIGEPGHHVRSALMVAYDVGGQGEVSWGFVQTVSLWFMLYSSCLSGFCFSWFSG
jgi:hypothetical protein